MGQAKLRGTIEERMAVAKERESERLANGGKPTDKSTPTKREVLATGGNSWATIGMIMDSLPYNAMNDRD